MRAEHVKRLGGVGRDTQKSSIHLLNVSVKVLGIYTTTVLIKSMVLL